MLALAAARIARARIAPLSSTRSPLLVGPAPLATRLFSKHDHKRSPRHTSPPFSARSPARDGRSAQQERIGPTSSSEPSLRSQQPLPDLRRGIPSAFDVEQAQTDARSHHTPDPVGAAEDGGAPRRPKPGAAGARAGGELPRSAYETSVDRRRNNIVYYGYILAVLGIGVGAVFLGRNWATKDEEEQHPNAPSGWGFHLMYNRAKQRLKPYLGLLTEPTFPQLLPDFDARPPYTLVLSLEDMLVHTEWTREHGWRHAKRPGVDYFMLYLSQYYELVLFTTVRMQDAEPIVRKLDPFRIITWPLFREASRYENGEYIKV